MQETTFVMVSEGTNTEEQEALCSFLLLHTNSFIKGGYEVANYCGNR